MKTTLAMFCALLVAGCSTYAMPRYSANAETVSALRALRPSMVRVGSFANPNNVARGSQCRGVGPVEIPDGESFEAYVRKALVSELIMAEVYDPKSPIEITGVLERAEFSSGNATWSMAMTLASTTGATFHVENQYSFGKSFMGDTACVETAQAGLGATQDLIHKAVADDRFKTLVR